MQKLVERNTYTPQNISHVLGNCDPVLKAPRGKSGVLGLKTSSNNSDAGLTAPEQAERNLRVSVVYVLNMHGEPLMPCSPRKARVLLKEGNAQVRKCNRKLHKGIRSHIKNTAQEYIKGFKRYDKVKYKGKEVFIFGRRKTGYFDLRKLDNTKIHNSAKYKDLSLLESGISLLTSIIGDSDASASVLAEGHPLTSPCLKAGVSRG